MVARIDPGTGTPLAATNPHMEGSRVLALVGEAHE